MPKMRLAWNMTAEGAGGRRIGVGQTLYVDAFDEVRVTATKSNWVSAEIQPTADTEKVLFLLIKADRYDETLACEVRPDDDSDATKTLTLDGPLVLIGKAALNAIADAGEAPENALPQKLYFTSALDEDVSIDVFVGRLATDEPPP